MRFNLVSVIYRTLVKCCKYIGRAEEIGDHVSETNDARRNARENSVMNSLMWVNFVFLKDSRKLVYIFSGNYPMFIYILDYKFRTEKTRGKLLLWRRDNLLACRTRRRWLLRTVLAMIRQQRAYQLSKSPSKSSGRQRSGQKIS
jgi:hypothetical protein